MEEKTLDIQKIMECLPHRYPFLLVDRVIDYEQNKSITAIKNVTMNELFFQGHFPGAPVMPGVLQIEALAQTGGILAMLNENNRNKLAFFMTIDNAKFRKPVVPGDQLIMKVEVTKVIRETILKVHGQVEVDGKKATEADLMFSIVDKEKVK